jgi:hypothetical protein
VTDLSRQLFVRVSTLLEAQRASIARWAGMLEAQRAALRSDDLELLADVSSQAALLLQSLEESTRGLDLARGPLSETEGPRTDTVRETMAAIAAELEVAFANIRQFSEVVQERRSRVVRALQEQDGAAPGRPGSSFRSAHPDSAFLDRSG